MGEPANLLVWDPRPTSVVVPEQQATRSTNSPYRGQELPGRNVLTLLRGRPTVRDGEPVARA